MVKSKLKQLEVLCLTWEKYAPTESFSGVTLEQLKARLQRLRDARGAITNCDLDRKGHIATRAAEERESNDVCLRVMHAIRGDVKWGEESDFYRSNGYKTKSERRRGLRRIKIVKLGEEQAPGAAI